MAVCKFDGNSDMYGLGIRLGYYLQWYGGILANWLAPSEVPGIRFSIDLFVAATFLALVIETTGDINNLQPVETYIILLLMFGAYLAIIPIYIWRLLTRCDPYWDPSRWPKVNPGAMYANLSFLLLLGVLIFQYWFWFDRVPDLDNYNCQQYGFLLAQVRLNSKVSVILNVLMYVFLGLVWLYLFALKVRHSVGIRDPQRKKRVISRGHKERHIAFLQSLDTWIKIVVAALVTVAVELTISWNNIEGVNTLSGAGNTIPFVIGIGAIVRVLYRYLFFEDDDDSDDGSYYSYSHGRPHRPGPLPDRDLPPVRMAQRYSGRRAAPSDPVRVDQLPPIEFVRTRSHRS